MLKCFLLIVLLTLPTRASPQAKKELNEFVAPRSLSKAESKKFEKAFDVSWRKLGLDETEESMGKFIKAKAYKTPLPVKALGKCNGKPVYFFDFSGYSVIQPDGTTYEMAPGYTGSGGTRIIIQSESSNGLSLLYDQNVIAVLGSKKNMGGHCPDVGVILSGANFTDAKSNNEYRVARLFYSIKSGQYQIRKDQNKRSARQ